MTEQVIALQGAAGFVVQARLATFARLREAEGLRVAGVIEEIVEIQKGATTAHVKLDIGVDG